MAKQNFNEQLTAFLQSQPLEQVAQWLASTVAADKNLKKQWQIKLLLASGKPSDYKKLLTQALPKKELLHTQNLWRKVGLYFDEAETLFALAFEQLDSLPEQVGGTSPKQANGTLNSLSLTNEQQFTWLMQAFERLNFVLETIDDSGGYRLNLVDQLSARLVRCFHQLDWSLEQKASWLHELQYKYDVFPYIPEQFELPTELQAAFVELSNKEPSQQTGQAISQPEQLGSSTGNAPNNVSLGLLETLKNRKKP